MTSSSPSPSSPPTLTHTHPGETVDRGPVGFLHKMALVHYTGETVPRAPKQFLTIFFSKQFLTIFFSRLRRGDFRYTTILYQSTLSKHFIQALYQSTLSRYYRGITKVLRQRTKILKHDIEIIYQNKIVLLKFGTI